MNTKLAAIVIVTLLVASGMGFAIYYAVKLSPTSEGGNITLETTDNTPPTEERTIQPGQGTTYETQYASSSSNNNAEDSNTAGSDSASCTDSDGGLTFNIVGTATGTKGAIKDACTKGSNFLLEEASCVDGVATTEKHDCYEDNKICENGACVEPNPNNMDAKIAELYANGADFEEQNPVAGNAVENLQIHVAAQQSVLGNDPMGTQTCKNKFSDKDRYSCIVEKLPENYELKAEAKWLKKACEFLKGGWIYVPGDSGYYGCMSKQSSSTCSGERDPLTNKGCSITAASGATVHSADYCTDASKVRDASCNKITGACMFADVTCPAGTSCSKGACIKADVVGGAGLADAELQQGAINPGTCKDYDNGLSYYTASYCESVDIKGVNTKKQDACALTKLNEGVCKNNVCTYTVYTCPGSCYNGVCMSTTTQSLSTGGLAGMTTYSTNLFNNVWDLLKNLIGDIWNFIKQIFS